MSRRTNFIIDDENWQHLNTVPRGERSRWVNKALAEYRRTECQRRAARNMDAMSRSLPAIDGHAEDWIREDRERDG